MVSNVDKITDIDISGFVVQFDWKIEIQLNGT